MVQNSKDSLSERFNSLKGDLKLYIEKRLELLALGSGERFATLMSQSVHRITGFVLLAIGGIFALVGLSIYLGTLLGEPWMGYLIVAAPLLLIGLFFVNLRPKSLNRRMKRRMVEQFFQMLPDEIGKSDNENKYLDLESTDSSSKSEDSANTSKNGRS